MLAFSHFALRDRYDRTSQHHVESLEDISKDREVSSGEDEGDNGGIGDGGCTRVFPLEKIS